MLEDMMNYVEVLRDSLAISGIDENDILIGQGLSYVTSRIGWYCLEHLDDFMSIVQDEKLREGFKSALMFLDEKMNSLANKKNRVTPKSGSAHHTALSLFSFSQNIFKEETAMIKEELEGLEKIASVIRNEDPLENIRPALDFLEEVADGILIGITRQPKK